MPAVIEQEPIICQSIIDQIQTEENWKVILFNCECHSFSQVVYQVQKATGFSEEQAERITHEAHTTGKSLCYSGLLEECEKVDNVLRAIGLRTELTK